MRRRGQSCPCTRSGLRSYVGAGPEASWGNGRTRPSDTIPTEASSLGRLSSLTDPDRQGPTCPADSGMTVIRVERRERVTQVIGEKRSDRALDLLEISGLARHRCYGDIAPSDEVIGDDRLRAVATSGD